MRASPPLVISILAGCLLTGCSSTTKNLRVAGYRPIHQDPAIYNPTGEEVYTSPPDERTQAVITALSTNKIPIIIAGGSEWAHVSVPEHDAERARRILHELVRNDGVDLTIPRHFVIEEDW